MINIKTLEKLAKAGLDRNINLIISDLQTLKDEAEIKNKKKLYSDITTCMNNIFKYYQQLELNNKKFNTNLTSNYESELYKIILPNILQQNIVLSDNIRENLEDLIFEYKNKEIFNKNNIQVENKLLLYGPPGTGKTSIVYYLGYRLNLPIINVRLDEIISSYLGKTGKNIKEVFDKALEYGAILFFDEIDTLAKSRADNNELGELKRVVTVFLQNIDFYSKHLILVGATNHPELLDRAIWRRFNLHIKTNFPSKEIIFKLIKNYIKIYNLLVDTKYINVISEISKGFSHADIETSLIKAIKKQISHNNYNQNYLLLNYITNLKSINNNIIRKVNLIELSYKLFKQNFTNKEIKIIINHIKN